MDTLRRLTTKARTKLTYTGPAFEVSVDSDTFSPRVVAHHGLPYPCTAIAYDGLLGLVAAGSIFGDIKVYGGNGVEVTLHGPVVAKITHLFFLPTKTRLVSLDSKNDLQLWDLKEQGPVKRAVFKENVTCATMAPSGSYCFFGLDDGRVLIFDLVQFQLSRYVIKPPTASLDVPVASIASNPSNENTMLISYDDGTLVLWDMNRQAIALTYDNQKSQPIQSMCWHASGDQFVTGHEDGSLGLWEIYSTNPLRRFCITPDKGKRSPVRQVEWSSGGGPYGSDDPSALIVTGGMMEYEPNGVVVLRGDKYSTHTLIALDDDCDYFIVISRDGSPDEPPRALMTFSHSQLLIHDIRFKGRMAASVSPSLSFPRALCMSDCYEMASPIVKMLEITQGGGRIIEDENRASTMGEIGLIDGGSISFAHEGASKQRVFATGHIDGIVQIWETGKGAFLRRIAVLHMEQLPIDEKLEFTSITIVRLSSDGRGDTILTIGFKTGHIAMLELGAHKMNVRNCISFNGHPVSVIVPVTSQYLVAGDKNGSLMLIDNKTGKSVATLQLESRSQVTCVEYVDLSAIPQGKPNAKNQTQAAATAKVVAHAAKSHDVLYIGLNNGTIHIVSLQTFSNIQTFSAKKPSRLHALVSFDPSWNRQKQPGSSSSAAASKSRKGKEDPEDQFDDGTTFPLLAVSENHVRIYSLPDNVYLSKITPEGAIHMAFLKSMLDAIFLVGFVDVAADEEGDNHGKMKAALVVYALPSLNLVSRQPVPFNIKNMSNSMCPDEDTVIVLTDHGEVVQLGLLAGSAPSTSGREAKVTLVTDRTSKEASSAAAREKTSHKLKAAATSVRAVKSLFKSGKDKKDALVDENINIDNLLKEKMQLTAAESLLSMEDNPFTDAMRALQERGEKLQELSNKTAELADEAANFYELSRKLRKSQQRKTLL